MAELSDLVNDIIERDLIAEQENEVLSPLLEELSLIDNFDIRQFVRAMLLQAPGSFWVAYADPSDIAQIPDPTDVHEGGLVIHLKKAMRILVVLADSWALSRQDKDLVFAACLLKDVCRIVEFEDGDWDFDDMYMYRVDMFVYEARLAAASNHNELNSSAHLITDGSLFDILKIIRHHRGTYSPVPETVPPKDSLPMLLHFADRLAYKMHGFLVDWT